jgi:hypothetical protein
MALTTAHTDSEGPAGTRAAPLPNRGLQVRSLPGLFALCDRSRRAHLRGMDAP